MKRKELLHYILLVFFAVIAYWPLASLHHPPKWDALEQYFPWRYFMSDCIRNGRLPLWNPYPGCGYPFYADPQSGAWYPVAWLMCGIAPYTLHSFAIEFVMTIVIGGIGMYRLVKSFDVVAEAALVAAMSYMACGFFISNAEHLTWVISGAWLPWVFWAYHRMVLSKKYGYGLLCALFLFLLLSGGYPAFITITLYLIILFFVVLMCRGISGTERWTLIGLHAVTAIVFVVLGSVVMLSWYQAYPFISRGAGLTLEKVNANPFTPQCIRSLLLPFATLKDLEYYRTDTAMRNAYMGICMLVFGIAGILSLRGRKNVLIVIVSLFCLGSAMGEYLPIRGALYRFVPLMGMFRFPAMFRIFFIIGILVIGAQGISDMLRDGKRRKVAGWVGLAILGLLVVLFLQSISKGGFICHWGSSIEQFKEHLAVSTHSEHVQLQSLLQIVLVGVFLAICLFRKGRYFNGKALIVYCAVDMVIAASLNAFGTVVDFQTVSAVTAPIKDAPRYFRVPDNSVAIRDNNDDRRSLGLLRTNTSIYFKTPAADGYDPFILNNYNKLAESPIHDSVWAHPYLYFATDAQPYVDSSGVSHFKTVVADKAISVFGFSPGNVKAVVSTTTGTSLLILQQSYFNGWKVTVDGKPQQMLISNYALMSVLIPAGRNHKVEWKFEPQYIRAFALLSLLSIIILVIGLCLLRGRLF